VKDMVASETADLGGFVKLVETYDAGRPHQCRSTAGKGNTNQSALQNDESGCSFCSLLAHSAKCSVLTVALSFSSRFCFRVSFDSSVPLLHLGSKQAL
jgi:hypothetical protein